MTDKLSLYNAALYHLGEVKLDTLTEEREARYTLDEVYAPALKFCLEQGFWKFATRSSMYTASSSATPDFGYQNAFEKPSDWVRTYQVSTDEYFRSFLNDMLDENDYWFADEDSIYVRYISNDPAYGLNLGKWPETYTHYVALILASRIAKSLTGTVSLVGDMLTLAKKAKDDALSKDAMNGRPERIPSGSWVRSRRTSYRTEG